MRLRFCIVFMFALVAGSASLCEAQLAWPPTSTWPRHVVLVGTDASGVADPAGAMTFAIRDVNHFSYGNPLIILDFSNSPGIALCATQPDPAVTVDCATGIARWFGDQSGQVTVRLVGRADRSVPGSHAASCRLSVDGVQFGTIPISAPDEDGLGLGAADLSLWLQDYFSNQYWERSDFDGNGTLGSADLSFSFALYFGGGSVRSCSGSVCP